MMQEKEVAYVVGVRAKFVLTFVGDRAIVRYPGFSEQRWMDVEDRE